VCTTKEPNDDVLAETIEAYGGSVYRGSTDDIIERFYMAMSEYGFDAVLQADGDDILSDTYYMEQTMNLLLDDPSLDIVTCKELPFGIASKSFTSQAMEKVYKHYQTCENDTGFNYFFTKTGLCSEGVVYPAKPDHKMDEVRLTLDYPVDLEVFTKIFEALYVEGEVFNLDGLLGFLRNNPEIVKINANLEQQYWSRFNNKAKLKYKDKDGTIKFIAI
jgi:spore coat polysaccharide biosynthesis protein SpsF